MARRHYLGSLLNVAQRVEVYAQDNAFEVDDRSGVDLARRWYYFDEVQMVTLHQHQQRLVFWLLLGLALAMTAGASLMALMTEDATERLVASAIYGGLALTMAIGAAVVRAVPLWTITLHTSRGRARWRFWREERARQSLAEVVQRIADGQRPGASPAPTAP